MSKNIFNKYIIRLTFLSLIVSGCGIATNIVTIKEEKQTVNEDISATITLGEERVLVFLFRNESSLYSRKDII